MEIQVSASALDSRIIIIEFVNVGLNSCNYDSWILDYIEFKSYKWYQSHSMHDSLRIENNLKNPLWFANFRSAYLFSSNRQNSLDYALLLPNQLRIDIFFCINSVAILLIGDLPFRLGFMTNYLI